jgi:hypothetical protein
MKIFALALWIFALLGCSHRAPQLPAVIAGTYSYGAFDLTLNLELRSDGTYRESEIGPLIVLGRNGEQAPPKLRDEGRFFLKGDEVVLQSESGLRRTLQRVAGPPALLRERVGSHVRDYSEEKPNKAPEPTKLCSIAKRWTPSQRMTSRDCKRCRSTWRSITKTGGLCRMCA